MENDYPTDEELKTIAEWDHADPIGLMNFIRPYWEQHGWWKQTGKKVVNLQISTGGWSGNESIIEALHSIKGNMFFFLWWQKSVRGGHYWFKIKPFKKQ